MGPLLFDKSPSQPYTQAFPQITARFSFSKRITLARKSRGVHWDQARNTSAGRALNGRERGPFLRCGALLAGGAEPADANRPAAILPARPGFALRRVTPAPFACEHGVGDGFWVYAVSPGLHGVSPSRRSIWTPTLPLSCRIRRNGSRPYQACRNRKERRDNCGWR
jgi:hypothetical protein